MKKLILLFVLLSLLIGVRSFWPGSQEKWVQIDVNPGTSAHQVLKQLQEEKLLRLKFPFLIWTKLRDAGQKIKVGRYRFGVGRSAFWVVDDLIKGNTQKIRLVIPEGFASWQIAERLEQLEISQAKPFLDIVKQKELEGFLYPATYELDYGLSPAAVARFLKSQFDQNWKPTFDPRLQELGWTQKQAVTLASIIEREVMVRDELPWVSSLYNNRLRKKMPLEADPTVQYALGYWKSRLFYKDYRQTKSPYNTYLNKGLPPGPICSPGLDAIEAALFPAESEALFMVAKEDGTHDFSNTYREHVNKVNRRNKRRRQQR